MNDVWQEGPQERHKVTNVTLKKKGESGIEVPRISIILSAYNEGERLDSCLAALTKQTLKELEIICINDGSEDDTLDQMMAWGEKDPRITVLSQENRGSSSGRNHGVEIAIGEYLYFCDAEEILHPEALWALYSCAKKGQLDVLFFRQAEEPKENLLEESYTPQAEDGWKLFVRLMKESLYSERAERQLLRREYYQEQFLNFYEGILYGDHMFTYKSISHAKRAAFAEGDLLQEIPEKAAIAPSFREVYGLLMGLMMLETELGSMHRAAEEEEAVASLSEQLLQKARRVYHDLPEEEREKAAQLLPKEAHFFRLWIEEHDQQVCSEQDLRKSLTEQEIDHKAQIDELLEKWNAEKAIMEEERRHTRSEIDSQRGELRHLAAELRASSLEKQFLRDHCAELEASRSGSGGKKHAGESSAAQEPVGMDGIEIPTVNEYDLTPGQYGGSLRNNWRASNASTPESDKNPEAESDPESVSEEKKRGIQKILQKIPRRNRSRNKEKRKRS